MKRNIIISLATLISGIFIYCIFDLPFVSKSNVVFSFIRNYIPDAVWTMSFFCISCNFMKNITKKYILATAVYTFLLGCIFEICQLNHLVKGTFDILDLLAYISAIIFTCFIEKSVGGIGYEKD